MNKIKEKLIIFTKRLFKKSNFKIIFISYLSLIIVSSLLLYMPYSQNDPNNGVSYIDALFTVSSAFSDTGLTTVITSETWSTFGQAVIAILIFFGGAGIFALKYYFINFIFKRSLSYSSRIVLDKERSSRNLGDALKTIRVSISILLVLVIISSIILSITFYHDKGNFNIATVGENVSINDPYLNIGESIRFAVFHSISALNNAGFDIIGGKSLSPYYFNYGIQIVFLILFIVGGIGYPVLFDLYQYFTIKIIRRGKFKFSLFTKLSCITYFFVALIGLSLTFLFETLTHNNNTFWNINDPQNLGNKWNKSFAIFFNTMSTRNAGFATFDLKMLSTPSLVIYMIMMFIGSAPSSTAGGIRTTTLALVVLGVIARIKNANDIKIFKRKIENSTTTQANATFAVSIFIVIIATLICFSSLDNIDKLNEDLIPGRRSFDEIDIFFEVFSAFGTTGLSTGITSSFNIISKISIIVVMFIGQLGISSTLLVVNEKNKKDGLYSYISENILIG